MIALLLLLSAATGADAGDDLPYLAEIQIDQAEVRAGAGKRNYLTERLPRGTVVEVHRRDLAGWLAIRPPEGSFSWVPAEELKETDDPDIFEVVGDEAASWIGSRIEKVSNHRFHVRLKLGERVEVIGEKRVPVAEGEEQLWYKIAPPAGEFRWIHGRDVGRKALEATVEVKPVEKSEEKPVIAVVAATEPPKPQFKARSTVALKELERREAPPEPLMSSPKSPAEFARAEPVKQVLWQEAATKGPATTSVDQDAFVKTQKEARGEPIPKTDGFVARGAKSEPPALPPSPDITPLPVQPAAVKDIGSGLAPKLPWDAKPAAISEPKKILPRQDFDRQLNDIDAELSLMVARDPRTWQLAALRQKLDALIEQGETATDRGRGRILAEKIHRFAETFGVEDDPRFAGLTPPPALDGTAPVGVIGTGVKAPDAAAFIDPKYDGTGWLKTVVSRDRPAAPYAIVDADGKPRAFITPSPGLNLNRYLNKPIGVYGQRGYIESLHAPHITAERIIDLDRHQQR